MAGIKDSDHIDDLRQRLYARNASEVKVGRHQLSPNKTRPVPRVWREAAEETTRVQPPASPPRVDARVDMRRPASTPEQASSGKAADRAAPNTPESTTDSATSTPTPTPAATPRRRPYRLYVVVASLLVLVAVVGFSSVYLLLGLNEISGRNIDVSVDAPSSIGSGETIPIDVTIGNQNPVPVSSATLIMTYPDGTQSAEEEGRVVQTERIPLERIASGASFEVPVRAVVFGQVDEEKEIGLRLEYRVEGTNSTLERPIDPVAFRITSTPIVVRVDTVERVSAGQEVDIEVTLESNAPNTIHNVLLTAEYPGGFDFTESDPEPAFGNNTWRFDAIESGESETVTLNGAFIGGQDDEFAINFTAGVPREDNQYILGSTFSRTQSDFVIEQPFIDVRLSANGEQGDVVTLESGRSSSIDLSVTNTLTDPVYDMFVTATLSGNAIDSDGVNVRGGFYDSSTDTVRFDVSTDDSLTEVPAGSDRDFRFTLQPELVGTAQTEVDVSVYARRVFEDEVQEQLVGSKFMTIQYDSAIGISSVLSYNDGPFSNTGPIPPVAEEETTYTLTLSADAGANDLIDGRVTTSLPTYISWRDTYEGPGSVSYNSVNKEITWDVGSIDANDSKELAVQVGFRPSRSQIGVTPTMLNQQHFRATDRFTGSIVREVGDPVSAELGDREGYDRDSGRVVEEPADDSPVADGDEAD